MKNQKDLRGILNNMLGKFCQKFNVYQELDKIVNSKSKTLEIDGKEEIDQAIKEIGELGI